MWDSKTFCIPEAYGLRKVTYFASLNLGKNIFLSRLSILATNHPIPSKIHQHAVKRYPNCWTLMELVR